MRCATLPMYAEPELRPAIERWWAGVARPSSRSRGDGRARCAHLVGGPVPGVALSGPRVQSDLRPSARPFASGSSVQVVATPHYEAPGCEGPTIPELHPGARGRRRTWKRRTSASWSCPGSGSPSMAGTPGPAIGCGAESSPLPSMSRRVFGDVVITGSHRESVRSRAGGTGGRLRRRLREPRVAGRPGVGRAGRHAYSRPLAASAGASLHHRRGDHRGRARTNSGGTVRGARRSSGLAQARATLLLTGASILTEADLPPGVRGVAPHSRPPAPRTSRPARRTPDAHPRVARPQIARSGTITSPSRSPPFFPGTNGEHPLRSSRWVQVSRDPELAAHDLAGARLRHVVDELYRARHLVGGEVLAAVGDDALLVRRLPGLSAPRRPWRSRPSSCPAAGRPRRGRRPDAWR